MPTTSQLNTPPASADLPPASALPVVLERIDRFVARTQNWFYDHMRFLPRHRPVVVCSGLENRDEFPDLEALQLDPERLDRRVWRKLGSRRLYPPDARRLHRYQANAFHSHLGYVAVGDFPFVEALQIPWVVSFYGADVYMLGRNPVWHERYGPMFARAAKVLSLGPAMSAALESMGCPAGKLMIHPLGVDAGGLPHQPRVLNPGEPIRILFSGTMREKKGAVYLIEALGRLARQGVRFQLHMVGDVAGRPGDAETKAEIFRLIGQQGLADRVEHHSWLPFRDLVQLGLGCHLFVAPSVTASDGDCEGTPAVMGQMMATGMATIATRHSDIPYTFGPYAGTLLLERDAGAIADRIAEYVADPARLTRDGLALREHILKTFDLRICAAALSDVYDEIGDGRPR